MSRDFVLDEPASSFTELQYECLNDLFCSTIEDELSVQDKTYLNYINQAHRQYSKVQRKAQKGVKNAAKSELQLGKLSTDAAETIKKFTSFEELSDENSVLCDLSDIVLPLLNISLPRSTTDQVKLLDNLLKDEAFISELSETVPYLHLFSLANHRTIIKVPKLQIDENILLNDTKLFTKLPLWSLCLDLSDCDIKDENGSKITGASLMFSPCGLGAKSLMNKVKSQNKKGSVDNDWQLSLITFMICFDNSEYLSVDLTLPVEAEMSIDDAFKLIVQINSSEFAVLENIISNVKDIYKYACYVLTHQHQIMDDQGKVAVLNNMDLLDMIPNSSLASLGSRDLPLKLYQLQA